MTEAAERAPYWDPDREVEEENEEDIERQLREIKAYEQL